MWACDELLFLSGWCVPILQLSCRCAWVWDDTLGCFNEQICISPDCPGHVLALEGRSNLN